ncbi:YybH family protein [Actinokineospora pegani]|uniref:YybH family protein n=1 Tax=Actinokineospora pegani TaxID=2654637 RepID=UPI0012EA384D|nr:nuclear transport factor 2 family protein [Actinokineospora pegani]
MTTTIPDLETMVLTADPQQQNDAFLAAFNSGKGAIFDRLYLDDAVSNLSGAPLTGAARTEAITALLASGPKLQSSVKACYSTADTSLIIVEYVLDITDAEGKGQRIKGICTDVLTLREDGNWWMSVDRPIALETTPID